jgi:hypothetical protein
MTCTLVPCPERTDDERIDINDLRRADIETIDWDRVMIEADRRPAIKLADAVRRVWR